MSAGRLVAVAALAWTVLPGCANGPGSDAWVETQVAEAHDRLDGDDPARRVLESIRAHGGLEAWFGTPTSAFTWEYSNLGSDMRFASYQVADNRTRRIYHDLNRFGTPDSVAAVEARFAWDGERAWISPGERTQPNPSFWALTGYYFQFVPFVFADPGVRFRQLPPEELEATAYDRVMAYFEAGVGDTPGDIYVMYLDPEADQVRALLYTVTYGREYVPPAEGGPEPPRTGTLLFYEDYVTEDGLTIPTRFRGYAYEDGDVGAMRNEAWTSDISFEVPFDESRLELPEDGRVVLYPIE